MATVPCCHLKLPLLSAPRSQAQHPFRPAASPKGSAPLEKAATAAPSLRLSLAPLVVAQNSFARRVAKPTVSNGCHGAVVGERASQALVRPQGPRANAGLASARQGVVAFCPGRSRCRSYVRSRRFAARLVSLCRYVAAVGASCQGRFPRCARVWGWRRFLRLEARNRS